MWVTAALAIRMATTDDATKQLNQENRFFFSRPNCYLVDLETCTPQTTFFHYPTYLYTTFLLDNYRVSIFFNFVQMREILAQLLKETETQQSPAIWCLWSKNEKKNLIEEQSYFSP